MMDAHFNDPIVRFNAEIDERELVGIAVQAANSARASAESAEQSAGQSGYMYFYIDGNGDLIYQRTPNVNVDFYLSDGDLYVEAIA